MRILHPDHPEFDLDKEVFYDAQGSVYYGPSFFIITEYEEVMAKFRLTDYFPPTTESTVADFEDFYQ